MIGIYKITNKVNDKCYIGESMNIEDRWQQHKKDLEDGAHHSYKLQEDYNTYGMDNFSFEILKEIDSIFNVQLQKMLLLVYEHRYINKFDSIQNGYNLENTILKIINKEKSIYYDGKIDDKYIKSIIKLLKSIEKNNGEFRIRKNSSNSKTKRNTKKNSSKKKTEKTSKEYIPKESNLEINSFPITFKNCLDFILLNYNYKLNCNYNMVYEKLRNLNIFYYNDEKINLPCSEYLNTYFIVKDFKYSDDNIQKRIYVTYEGLDFVKNILINNMLVS